MSKSILISIRPEFVSKILNGEKTIEIRKTKPSCELPIKVYIYCTKNNGKWIGQYPFYKLYDKKLNDLNGKVVGEFTLNKIDFWQPYWTPDVLHICTMSELSCVDVNELQDYSKGERIYAWHIDDLKIYDKPKELSEFSNYIPNNECPTKQCGTNCEDCPNYDEEHNTCLSLYYAHRQIKRPPQSYMFVEELEGINYV